MAVTLWKKHKEMDITRLYKLYWNANGRRLLSHTATRLYFALLHHCEATGALQFKMSTKEIKALTGLCVSSMLKARKELRDAGLISFRRGRGRRSPEYCLPHFMGAKPVFALVEETEGNFTPPTYQDVCEQFARYSDERPNYRPYARGFYNYYKSSNWIEGGKPFITWREHIPEYLHLT